MRRDVTSVPRARTLATPHVDTGASLYHHHHPQGPQPLHTPKLEEVTRLAVAMGGWRVGGWIKGWVRV